MSGLDWLSPGARVELEALIDARIRDALAAERAKRWLSVKEAANYLGISEVAVRRRVGRGRVPAKRQGRSLLVDRVALDRAIEAS